jgi:hypothetical protein
MYTAEGAIFDSKGQPLHGVTVALADVDTGNITKSTALQFNTYKVWDDYDVYVIFSKPGYQEQKIPLSSLQGYSEIIMNKGGGSIAWLLAAGIGIAYVMSDGKKVGKVNSEDVKTGLYITGGLVGLVLVGKLFTKLGLGADPAAGDATDPGSPWKPNYWQQFSSYTYAISQAQAEQYSKSIHDSFTVTQDDFNRIKSVFFALRTKANVSYLSYIFTAMYNEDLLSFLGNGGGILPWDGLSSSQMQTLIDYVNKLQKN